MKVTFKERKPVGSEFLQVMDLPQVPRIGEYVTLNSDDAAWLVYMVDWMLDNSRNPHAIVTLKG